MSNYTENFPNLSTYDFDTIMCQLKQVCGADTSGLINAQFLSRPTTAKDIAQLFYCTKYIMDGSVNLQNQYVELYNFVKDFFTNLDLQEEVNTVLERMMNDGTLSNLIKPIIMSTLPPLVVDSTTEMIDKNRSYVLKSNSHIYQNINNEWVDTGVVFGGSIGNVIECNGFLDNDYDLNNVASNTCYILYTKSGGRYTNYPPTDFEGNSLLFTIEEPDGLKYQIIFLSAGVNFTRVYHVNDQEWVEWRTQNDYIGTLEVGSDINNFVSTQTARLSPYNTGQYLNYPDIIKNINVISILNYIGTKNLSFQVLTCENGIFLCRANTTSGFDEWHTISNFIGTLDNGFDLNNVTPNTKYRLKSFASGNYVNYPEFMKTSNMVSELEFNSNGTIGMQKLTFENGTIVVRAQTTSGFANWKTKDSVVSDNSPIGLNNAYSEKRNPFSEIKDFSVTGATVKIFNNVPYIVHTKQMMSYPCFSIIDDDTSSLELVQMFHTLCSTKNIIGNYGVLTGRNDTNIYNTLLNYELEGYGMLYHGLTQNSAYLQERNSTSLTDFVTGYRKFKELGFTDNKMWVIPYGTAIKSILELAPMYGFIASFTTGTSTPVLNNGRDYSLNRINIGPYETGGDYNDLEWHKNVIDTYSVSNCWFVYTTHVNAWGDKTEEITQLFNNVVDYLISKNVHNVNAICGYHMYKEQMNRNVFIN